MTRVFHRLRRAITLPCNFLQKNKKFAWPASSEKGKVRLSLDSRRKVERHIELDFGKKECSSSINV